MSDAPRWWLTLCVVSSLILQTPLEAAETTSAAPTPYSAATPTTPGKTPLPPTTSGTKDPLIEVSVDTLEISENNMNKLGILWGSNVASQTGSPATLNAINFVEQSIPAIFDIGKLSRDFIAGTLDLLLQKNQARILANPTLLTKSGFEASFAVGGEIPYPTVGQGGVGGVEFKKYGINLKILPQLTPRHTIDAQINVGVSDIDTAHEILIPPSTTPVPGLTNREAGSKVEVNDGETVVLAGIKSSNRSKTINKVPVLGYIPLLGLLFTHKNETITQTSIVIFVTFRLVNGAQPAA